MDADRIEQVVSKVVKEVLGEEVVTDDGEILAEEGGAKVVDFVCPKCGERMDDESYPGLWAKPMMDGNNELLVCEADKIEGDTLLLNLIGTGEMMVDKVYCTGCTAEFGPEDFGVKQIFFSS